jgi:hypothetical protein
MPVAPPTPPARPNRSPTTSTTAAASPTTSTISAQAPTTPNAPSRPTGAELLRRSTLKAVAKGLLDIPEPADAATIQRDTLTGAVKDAACDYLEQGITSGSQPDSSAFYDSLDEKLADYGTPAQNQLNAIQESFEKLEGLLTGATDAREAAKSIGCALIPG